LSSMFEAEDFLSHLPSKKVLFGSDEVCRMDSR